MNKKFTNTVLPPTPKTGPDITVSNQGSLILFRPITPEAKAHLEEKCADAQWFGGAVACDHRYAGDLAINLHNDGFTLE